MTFQKFIETYNGKFIDLCSKTGSMNYRMFGSSNYDKGFQPIINSDSVNMVDNFRRFKISSKCLFHNQPVFRNFIMMCFRMVRTICQYVSLMILCFTTFPTGMLLAFSKNALTFIRKKLSFPAFEIPKLTITVSANEFTLTGQIITGPATKTGVLTRRSLIRIFTDFTDINHIRSIQHTMYGGNT